MASFQNALNFIRSQSETEYGKGRLFERLMKTFFFEDPLYKDRFTNVQLWSEWASERSDFDGRDTGIDLVALEEGGGYCAIQCKCYADDTHISKDHIDSFISASSRKPFSARIIVDTGASWGENAKRTVEGLTPPCTVIRKAQLEDSTVEWPDLSSKSPEDLTYIGPSFELRPHQEEAHQNVLEGFENSSRGNLIMACGTGKTFLALRIAESIAGRGGRILYLVPSIALFSQVMREWASQKSIPHRYIGICSDTRTGKVDEDASMVELEIPVSTDPFLIGNNLNAYHPNSMVVTFCTYHSLPIVEKAQQAGADYFDLIICDESHRTTGVEHPGDKTSPFVLVHDEDRILGHKRLYMTATPRIYTPAAQTKAARHDIDIFSMDDLAIYGPEFHRLSFTDAVELGLLSDFKVVVQALSEEHVDPNLQLILAQHDSELNLTDAAKIVGCWRSLQNPENQQGFKPLRRALAFTNTIDSSKRLANYWNTVIETADTQFPKDIQLDGFQCETDHVDGQQNALDRRTKIDWLKKGEADTCRILSNVRCLSEGVDVPALDAVLFMSPRSSHVDIVQAVGRVMRKSEGKRYGYIILPITIPPGVAPADALDDNERFSIVWGVLQALRSHDERFDAEINQIDLNKRPTDRIIINLDEQMLPVEQMPMRFPPVELPPSAFYAKVVERCGDRKYWKSWSNDVADIFGRLVVRLKGLLKDEALRTRFNDFHQEMRASINDTITADNAIEMMAQHLITRPIFEALFDNYAFGSSNPVASALDALERDFGDSGLANEVRDLKGFYDSVRRRASGLDNAEARQQVLMDLYENFFSTAMKKDADRLGIVYTPTEIVDFILHSADHVLREEFGRTLSSEGVHVLDPFTGTGIFLARLIQSGLIEEKDVFRKYTQELHANEIVLLAYYIATVHIEEAFHGRQEEDSDYVLFPGIALTDTFNLGTSSQPVSMAFMTGNNERVKRQRDTQIQVIVGNPPWSAGQRSEADENPNIDYPALEKRVSETYAKRSTSTRKSTLYDYYKMAIRWASDRIGKQGVVAFVTNGSWITGNVDSGVRACLAEEFNSIWVLDLRGNQRTQGERSRQEGGKVFGQGSRAPVSITLLIRNQEASHEGCRILYRDIGDYLNREEKLSILKSGGSIRGLDGWIQIEPDRHYDWIEQRNESFQTFYPVGSKSTKEKNSRDSIFKLYSLGLATFRDAYLYSYSSVECEQNAYLAVEDYLSALDDFMDGVPIEHTTRENSKNLRWDVTLKENVKRKKEIIYDREKTWITQYRPFVKQFCYVEYILVSRKYQQDKIFPFYDTDNRAICVTGVGSKKGFSTLIVNAMPDIQLMFNGQCFPRYRYEQTTNSLFGGGNLERIDNVLPESVEAFQKHYRDSSITADLLFDYLYGVLHAQDYREQFANDLVKGLPRVPFAPDFYAFARAGAELANLHLNYENCEQYPLDEVGSAYDRIDKSMRLDVERGTLKVNDNFRLEGIPPVAHRYQVNGRSPLAWFVDRYRVKTDNRSGITNDPNDWWDEFGPIAEAIKRIVHVSVETVRIVESLPPSLT